MSCKCEELGYRPDMDFDELIESVVRPENYCTSLKRSNAGYLCPTIDAALVRTRAERDRRTQYKKRLAKQGKVTASTSKSKSKFKVPENFQPRKRERYV